MKQVIDGKQYDTETADKIASDHYWDGSNWDRNGRSNYLYKTRKGAFFVLHETRWQGERDHIKAVSIEEARRQYEALPEHDMEFAEAFGEEPEEA